MWRLICYPMSIAATVYGVVILSEQRPIDKVQSEETKTLLQSKKNKNIISS